MQAKTVLNLALLLLKGVLVAAHQDGLVELEEAVQNGITELTKVHGTAVMKAQVDSLTITKLWADA